LVWIVVALVSWSPISSESSKRPLGAAPLVCAPCLLQCTVLTIAVLNYTFVALGLAFSATFLLRNLYPVLSTTENKTSKILLVVVLALHAGFAIAIKVLFFAATSPVGPNKGDDEKTDPARMLF